MEAGPRYVPLVGVRWDLRARGLEQLPVPERTATDVTPARLDLELPWRDHAAGDEDLAAPQCGPRRARGPPAWGKPSAGGGGRPRPPASGHSTNTTASSKYGSRSPHSAGETSRKRKRSRCETLTRPS